MCRVDPWAVDIYTERNVMGSHCIVVLSVFSTFLAYNTLHFSILLYYQAICINVVCVCSFHTMPLHRCTKAYETTKKQKCGSDNNLSVIVPKSVLGS